MKYDKRCPKCQNNYLLYISNVADQYGHAGAVDPAKLAYIRNGLSIGLLEAAMCRKCGYTEFYVKDPQNVRPDNKQVFEVVGPALQRTS